MTQEELKLLQHIQQLEKKIEHNDTTVLQLAGYLIKFIDKINELELNLEHLNILINDAPDHPELAKEIMLEVNEADNIEENKKENIKKRGRPKKK